MTPHVVCHVNHETRSQTRESQNRVDIMHYHIDTDTPKQERWAQAKTHYGDVMRDPDSINFITLFREPRDRLLSFYTFFVEFETLVRGRKNMWYVREAPAAVCVWGAT